jgi:hypothetical protein
MALDTTIRERGEARVALRPQTYASPTLIVPVHGNVAVRATAFGDQIQLSLSLPDLHLTFIVKTDELAPFLAAIDAACRPILEAGDAPAV